MGIRRRDVLKVVAASLVTVPTSAFTGCALRAGANTHDRGANGRETAMHGRLSPA